MRHVPGVSRLTNPCPSIMIRYVPKYFDELDAMLRALADPTRRAVVERLAKSPAVVSELAAPFSMALPSLMQHLCVLDVLHLWLGEQRTPAEHRADRLGIHMTRATRKET